MNGDNETREVAVSKYFRKTPEQPKEVKNRGLKAVGGFLLILIGAMWESSASGGEKIIPLLVLAGGIYFLSQANLGGLNLILDDITSRYQSRKSDKVEKANSNSVTFTGISAVLLLSTLLAEVPLIPIICGIALLVILFRSDKLIKEAYEKECKKTEPKPSDQQMDLWLRKDVDRIKKSSLQKLDLLAEQLWSDPNDPICVVGLGNNAALAVGQDGFIRASIYDVLVVHLTDYHLGAYKCSLDLAAGEVTSESTQEYHYADVVSVSTQTDNSGFAVMVEGEKKSIASYQKFALSVASGEQIQIAISFPQLDNIINRGELAPSGADRAVGVIRTRLREKKGGTQG